MKHKQKSKLRKLFIFLYLVFALYFLSYPFEIISPGEELLSIEPWIIFIGGILLVIGGFSYFRKGRIV
ncbi:MAG: hypothetical protein WDZ62_00800 [Candidatus Pacearchaeota archaeon]